MEKNSGLTYRVDSSLTGSVKVAVVQPPALRAGDTSEFIQAAALTLFDEAIATRPDVVCLPEYLNCMNHADDHDEKRFGEDAYDLLDDVAARARQARCNVILPLIIDDHGKRYNRAYVIDRDGCQVGHFDKVHVTDVEREQFGIVQGQDWPVFDLDFGRVGVMICYDGCFVESSRILALRGVKMVFWPSLQRSYTRDQLELQTRSHAFFNYMAIARSSYGGLTSRDGDERMVGLSCICDAGGTILSSIDSQPGWTSAQVNLGVELRGARSFGGVVGNLRDMRFEDRRPDAYDSLTHEAKQPSLPQPHASLSKATQKKDIEA